jgi:(E)-4-hydroxy-3-methylbut-2-enyl-diphosphate synthase
VRITVDRDEAAAAVPHIKERLLKMGVTCRSSATSTISATSSCRSSGLRRGARQVPHQSRQCRLQGQEGPQFGAIVETAIQHGKPVRIGANWGSLDQELLTHLMDENARSPNPIEARAVTREAMVQSALLSAAARRGDRPAARPHHPLAKVSAVQDLIAVYSDLARARTTRSISAHRGRHGLEGHRGSRAALGVLLQQGIGDTIRISLTPEPGGDRTLEVKVAQESCRPWASACSCRWSRPARAAAAPPRPRSRSSRATSRASSTTRCRSGRRVSRRRDAQRRGHGLHRQRAGESKHADIGISLPGTGETPAAPVFIDGKKAVTLRGAPLRRLQADGDRLYRAPCSAMAGRTHRGE